MSTRRFWLILGGLLVLTLIFSFVIGHAEAKGQVSVIDRGHYSAEESKQGIPFHEREWANGSYSNTILNGPGEILIDLDEQLTVGATLTITPQGSANWVWNPANSSENTVWYVNNLANVSYSAWDTILKEQIVLYQPVRTIAWQINLSVKPQSLQITTEGNDYLIKDPAGTEEWIRIPMPFVVDALGVNRTLRYSWNNGKRQLTLNLDDSGLQYPLMIDPVYQVDTTYIVGYWPKMLVNASNYPQIIFGRSDYDALGWAVNVSGTWSVSSIAYAKTGSIAAQFPWGATISSTNDLPIITHAGPTQFTNNFTWYSSSSWRTQNTSPKAGGDGLSMSGDGVIGQSTSSGRVLFFFANNSIAGNLNLTRIESISGTTIDPISIIVVGGEGAASAGGSFSGKMNESNILNVVWDTEGSAKNGINWTTVTDSSSPAITTTRQTSIKVNASRYHLSMDINPLTDFPGIAYVAYRSTGTPDTDRVGRQINYSYFDGSIWNFEAAAKNESAAMSAMRYVGIAYNSSGTPYIAWTEATSGTIIANMILCYVYRISPGVWSSPVTIDDNINYFNPSIAFDSSDNLHIAYYEATAKDLMYYYEPLPSAAGAAPVASFTATPQAGVRNSTRAVVDQSTNTPTTVELYGSGPNPCIGNNVSFSPGGAVNIFPKNFSWCDFCMIAANAFGTDTECYRLYVSQPWVVM